MCAVCICILHIKCLSIWAIFVLSNHSIQIRISELCCCKHTNDRVVRREHRNYTEKLWYMYIYMRCVSIHTHKQSHIHARDETKFLVAVWIRILIAYNRICTHTATISLVSHEIYTHIVWINTFVWYIRYSLIFSLCFSGLSLVLFLFVFFYRQFCYHCCRYVVVVLNPSLSLLLSSLCICFLIHAHIHTHRHTLFALVCFARNFISWQSYKKSYTRKLEIEENAQYPRNTHGIYTCTYRL